MAEEPAGQEAMPEEMKGKAVVRLEGVYFAWRDEEWVLEDLTLAVPKQTFLGIIGPNGGGKTTLLRLILGELEPTRGRVEVFGRPASRLGRLRSRIGYLPQRTRVPRRFPATVIEVVLMGLFPRIGLGRRVGRWAREKAMQMLELVGMGELADSPVGNLSGGQQQRVFIARALVSEPELLLLDEPTAGVDTGGQEAFFELLARLRDELGLTIVMVTHDLLQIGKYADALACLCRTIHWHARADQVSEEEIRDAITCELDEFLQYGRRLAQRENRLVRPPDNCGG